MKTHTLGAGQFVEFILTRERNDMKIMRTAEKQILNKDMIVAMKIRSSLKSKLFHSLGSKNLKEGVP